MTEAIQVEYSCKQCGTVRRKLNVPARGDEDVKQWLDATVILIYKDHFVRSPGCLINKLDELWIPLPKDADETTKIGSVKV